VNVGAAPEGAYIRKTKSRSF